MVMTLSLAEKDRLVSAFSPTQFQGSSCSSFTAAKSFTAPTSSRLHYKAKGDMVMYEPGNDPPNKESSSGVWTALANTEKWITQTLAESSRQAAPGQPAGSNPYARKEVSYVCETADDAAMAIAGIFRHVREAREVGENHSQMQEQILQDRGPDYKPATLRQTQVVVCPWVSEFKSFHDFEDMLKAVNLARRNARDYVTDLSVQKKKDEQAGKLDKDWVVSINAASLHPKYGEKTPEEILEDMKREDSDGEVDLNLEEYKKMRNRARQSPYPTVVIEVRATPQEISVAPTGGDANSDPKEMQHTKWDQGQSSVSKEDIKRLELMFGQSASTNHPKKEMPSHMKSDDAFYDAIGNAFGIEEVLPMDPTAVVHGWVAKNDPSYKDETSQFLSCDAKHVDAAYEFVFSQIAGERILSTQTSDRGYAYSPGVRELKLGKRMYITMPDFVSTSATSFEKFAFEVNNIINTVNGLSDIVSVTTFHPEHILISRRSPVPTFVLQWYDSVPR